MKKKNVILVIIVVAIVVGLLFYFHYTSVWVSIANVVSFAIGVVLGWIAHILYGKYIKN